MILTKEQVDQLDEAGCQKAMKDLEKAYNLDKSFQDYMTPELWNDMDAICDTLLYLEDRLAYIRMSENAQKANATRWGNI